MKKYCQDLQVSLVERLSDKHVLLKLTHSDILPTMLPGQFVEVRVEHSPHTFLRRPISINNVDVVNNELWLLVAAVGEGTQEMTHLQVGARLDCLFPLGNSFTGADQLKEKQVLLIGGGVGVAPLLFQGKKIVEAGGTPCFLLGARSKDDLLERDLFEKVGHTFITTEDGTAGERGYVTNHSILQNRHFDFIQTCGPKPMMMSVAHYAREKDISCEVSLENMMACGLGACLCCVEKTVAGNLCVCTDGPVFNIKNLLW